MKRRAALGVVFALSALFAIPAMAPAQMMGNVTGDWTVSSTGAQFHKGVMEFSQQGDVVVGHYKGTPNALQINGHITNAKLSGTWRTSSGETGWLTITFSGTGKGFSGEWGFHGRTPEGNLVGTLEPAAKM
jgi:hypothetical protein